MSGKRHWLPCLLTALLATGCAQMDRLKQITKNDIERAEPLGLIVEPPQPNPTQTVSLAPYTQADRDGYTLLWMKKSDDLCAPYKSKIIQFSRDSRLATDFTSIILNSLATIFTPVNTVRGLAGAAAAVTGVGAAFQSDMFNGQVGEVLTSAIETARRNQAVQIRANLANFSDKKYNQYDIWAALRDVSDYHDMCSLNTALIQVRASLQATSPDGGLSAPAKPDQTPGGLPAQATNVIQSQKTPQPPPPPLPRVAPPLPREDPSDPRAALGIPQFNAIRTRFGLSSTAATSPGSPSFQNRVMSFQRCLGKDATGFLTVSQATAAEAGDAACLPTSPAPAGSTPPAPASLQPPPPPTR